MGNQRSEPRRGGKPNTALGRRRHAVSRLRDFLKEEIRFKRIDSQLNNETIQHKIQNFEEKLKIEVCADIPTTFWHRKQHVTAFDMTRGL